MNASQFITPWSLSVCRSISPCLPQTDIGPQRSLVVGSLLLASGQCVNLSWSCLHLVEIRPIDQSSGLIQAGKNGSTVTATGDFFTPDLVGSLIIWSNGSRALITEYSSPISVEVSTAGVQYAAAATVSLSYFTIIPASPDLVNPVDGVVSFGVVAGDIDTLKIPAGKLLHPLSLNEPGVVALTLNQSRTYFGPMSLSLVVTNNARNFSAQVTAVAHLKTKVWA